MTPVDHAELIKRIITEYPDGWGLSCSSPSLPLILPYCPPSIRVMAWIKPFRSFKLGVGAAYAWEPIIIFGGPKRSRSQHTVRDWVAAKITTRRGLAGVKPRRFAFWLFNVLNMKPQDTFHDLFLGSGAVSQFWGEWRLLVPGIPVKKLVAPSANFTFISLTSSYSEGKRIRRGTDNKPREKKTAVERNRFAVEFRIEVCLSGHFPIQPSSLALPNAIAHQLLQSLRELLV
jgi:hypothetical protein